MDGSEGFQAERVKRFAEKLRALGLNIRFEDGSNTLTVQATKRNLARTEAWLGYALEVPEKPRIFKK